MFFESSWSRKSIGDVDVVYHDGLYHLFHLVLPNHDFIAHAISDNALNWRRVDNALFIGDPGSWDDLMLWTMHVTPDPHQPGRWRMFYTGLSRRDQGKSQRIGLAVSDDLFRWRKETVNWQDLRGQEDPDLVKQARAHMAESVSNSIKAIHDPDSCFPLHADPEYYEASLHGRNWVSFRDPFYFRKGDRGWLLMAARVKDGPMIRRGCVGVLEESSRNHFRALPPLHAPMLYDDIEVPNLFELGGEYYLIGSLREDAKIRYWHATELGDPWRNYYDNVLLPKGNYAGRICRDERGILLWNFFTGDINDRQVHNLLLPPKRITRRANGQLQVSTFEGVEERGNGLMDTRCIHSLKGDRKEAFCRVDGGELTLVANAGFQGFVFDEEVDSFVLRSRVSMIGEGKCGILCRIDSETHDGYYVSLDLLKGVAQFRSWRTDREHVGEDMMRFETLQEGFWRAGEPRDIVIALVAFGSYLELTINGSLILSLADTHFLKGLLGFYVETAKLRLDELSVRELEPPTQADDHLVQG